MKTENSIFLIDMLCEKLAKSQADVNNLLHQQSDSSLESIQTIEKLGCVISEKNELIDSLNRKNFKLKHTIKDLNNTIEQYDLSERKHAQAITHALAKVKLYEEENSRLREEIRILKGRV